MPITKMRRMPTPMYPSTRPAVAIPRPTCGPCEASIWRCARWPKITANTDPIQKSQRMPSTNDATARPLGRVLSVAATGGLEGVCGGGGGGIEGLAVCGGAKSWPHLRQVVRSRLTWRPHAGQSRAFLLVTSQMRPRMTLPPTQKKTMSPVPDGRADGGARFAGFESGAGEAIAVVGGRS